MGKLLLAPNSNLLVFQAALHPSHVAKNVGEHCRHQTKHEKTVCTSHPAKQPLVLWDDYIANTQGRICYQ
nr:hypothetical protein [Ruegeria lacuscaerulensis]